MCFCKVSIFRETSLVILLQIKSDQKGHISPIFIKGDVAEILGMLISISVFILEGIFDTFLLLQ